MIVGTENEVLALLAVADVVREESQAVIQRLRELGIKKTILLTGDNKKTAEETRTLNIDALQAGRQHARGRGEETGLVVAEGRRAWGQRAERTARAVLAVNRRELRRLARRPGEGQLAAPVADQPGKAHARRGAFEARRQFAPSHERGRVRGKRPGVRLYR